jgi:tetratricopeptide (TPR) repeat protein
MSRVALQILAVVLLLCGSSGHAYAQINEAALRFDRGIRLVNAGDLSGALAEFQRAHVLAPSPLVAYNLGLLYAELNRPVQAVRALEQARQAGGALKQEQRERLQRVLSEQRARIGLVALRVNVREGAVQVDNVQVATLPLTSPLEVASGSHVIGVIAEGHAPARAEVIVAGEVEVELALQLVAIDARLAHIVLRSPLPAAQVFVDGEHVGDTPLEASVTVLPGVRQVELRRSGYISDKRALTLQQGASAELTLTPSIDRGLLTELGGTLLLEVSEDDARVSVDGGTSQAAEQPLLLPPGSHRLRIERGGFLPAERDTSITTSTRTKLHVTLEPTPETRITYLAQARRRRRLSWSLFGSGLAVGAGGLAWALLENGRLPEARDALHAARKDWREGGSCDLFTQDSTPELEAACRTRLNHASNRAHNLETLRTTGIAVAGLGAGLLLTGLLLLLTGPSVDKYETRAALTQDSGRWQLIPQLTASSAGLSVQAQVTSNRWR